MAVGGGLRLAIEVPPLQLWTGPEGNKPQLGRVYKPVGCGTHAENTDWWGRWHTSCWGDQRSGRAPSWTCNLIWGKSLNYPLYASPVKWR